LINKEIYIILIFQLIYTNNLNKIFNFIYVQMTDYLSINHILLANIILQFYNMKGRF